MKANEVIELASSAHPYIKEKVGGEVYKLGCEIKSYNPQLNNWSNQHTFFNEDDGQLFSLPLTGFQGYIPFFNERDMKTLDAVLSERMILEPQQQILDDSCVSACLSMLLRIDQQVIIDNFHEGYLKCEHSVRDYLTQTGIPFVRLASEQRTPNNNKIVLMAVPSLNIQGGMHYVIAQTTHDGGWCVFDPNNGKEGRKYYVAQKELYCQNDDILSISSYIVEYQFKISDVLKFWETNNA